MHRVAHQARAYPDYGSMERPGVFLLPPGWNANPLQGYLPAMNLPLPIQTPEWREVL